MTEEQRQKIQVLKDYVESRTDIKLTGLTLVELGVVANDLFSEYNDLIGHRVLVLMKNMRENQCGVVP